MIIVPKTTPVITASDVPVIEAGIAVYNAANTYVLGNIVQVNGTTNRKYKATQAVPAGIDPSVDVSLVSGVGTYWIDYGATNYARAFDEMASSKCTQANSIYYKFTTSDCDVVMLGNIRALSVRIKVINVDSATTILDQTYSTYTREVYDWADWTYAVDEFNSSFFKLLPMAFNTTMEIWIDNTGSTAEVGHIAFGRSKNYGLTLADPKPSSSRRGISTKTRDEWGDIITRRKARYRRMTVTCLIDSSSIDLIEDRLDTIVDTQCIFVGDERDGGYKSLLVFGEMKDHDMPIGITKTTYQLEIEGYL